MSILYILALTISVILFISRDPTAEPEDDPWSGALFDDMTIDLLKTTGILFFLTLTGTTHIIMLLFFAGEMEKSRKDD